mmetsp:Transcript_70510/g.188175  ORF Transcript_70510/g.188175 Transcript_70510/m.188175 type:complete len:395 (+) Transcript_70510:433-1617(+)
MPGSTVALRPPGRPPRVDPRGAARPLPACHGGVDEGRLPPGGPGLRQRGGAGQVARRLHVRVRAGARAGARRVQHGRLARRAQPPGPGAAHVGGPQAQPPRGARAHHPLRRHHRRRGRAQDQRGAGHLAHLRRRRLQGQADHHRRARRAVQGDPAGRRVHHHRERRPVGRHVQPGRLRRRRARGHGQGGGAAAGGGGAVAREQGQRDGRRRRPGRRRRRPLLPRGGADVVQHELAQGGAGAALLVADAAHDRLELQRVAAEAAVQEEPLRHAQLAAAVVLHLPGGPGGGLRRVGAPRVEHVGRGHRLPRLARAGPGTLRGAQAAHHPAARLPRPEGAVARRQGPHVLLRPGRVGRARGAAGMRDGERVPGVDRRHQLRPQGPRLHRRRRRPLGP